MSNTFKYIPFAVVLILVIAWAWMFQPKPSDPIVSGNNFAFYSATNTTTPVNITSWTAVYSGNGSQGYVDLCNNADSGVNVNNPIYLGFGATSTKPFGHRLSSGECYPMSQSRDNMFYGTIYAIASSATTTLLSVYK